MNHAGHQAHFLSRIDRLEREHAELALGLYRDPDIVRYLIQSAGVPDGDDRVALALDDEGRDGPFVIVTRDGRFVTCLGKGMKLGATRVLSRHALDRACCRVQGLREVVREAEDRGRQRIRRLFTRVLRAGATLSREEFDELLHFSPLIEGEYTELLSACIKMFHDIDYELSRLEHVRRHEPLLEVLWQTEWAIAHLLALIGSDEDLIERMGRWFDRDGEVDHGTRLALFCPLFTTGEVPLALRAAWLPARYPKVFLATLKRTLATTSQWARMLPCGVALTATALRHQKLHAEVRKLFERMERGQGEHASGLGRRLASLCLPALTAVEGRRGELATGARAAATPARRVGSGVSIWRDDASVEKLVGSLPAIATLEARDFYWPQHHAETLRAKYHFRDVRDSFLARQGGPALNRAKPFIAPKSPGRNEPCSCGSGKKYKRCCGLN